MMSDTREMTLDEQFKDGLDQDGAVALALQVDVLIVERDAAIARAEQVATDREAINEQLAGALEELGYPRDGGPEDATVADKMIFAMKGVSADRAELKIERDAAIARAEKAEAAAAAKPKSVTAKPAAAKVRKFGVVPNGDGLDRAALRASEGVEIAFVDAKGREIPGSQPIGVSGAAWRDHSLGLMLGEPVEIGGPASGPGYAIAGYALLVDGKHVATRMRMDPINVGAGARIKLVDDIVF